MLTQAGSLALLAAALLAWPRSLAGLRLVRAIGAVGGSGSAGRNHRGWAVPAWPRSPSRRALLLGAAVGATAQVWPWPIAVVVVAVATTVAAALVRGHRDRAVVREEQAAVEGLGVLVAELRAGRPPDGALTAASRHCAHPAVGALLARLGRSQRLGDRLDGPLDADQPMAPTGSGRVAGRGGPAIGAPAPAGGSHWWIRLVDGVRLSQRTGCALADVVAAVESDLARRAHQRADLRATAAGHRATVALLAGLPILGLAMGSGIGAEPVRILTTTTIGHLLLLTGVGLELLGLAWSRRLTGRALGTG